MFSVRNKKIIFELSSIHPLIWSSVKAHNLFVQSNNLLCSRKHYYCS